MKFLIHFILLNLLSITTLFCYADSKKKEFTKLNSISLIESLLGHEYSSRDFKNNEGQTVAASGLYFEEKGKFHINSYYDRIPGDGFYLHACDIQGDITQLSNKILLLTRIREEDELEEGSIDIIMSITIIDNKTLELDLIHPSHLRNFCGIDADMAIIGKYTKIK